MKEVSKEIFYQIMGPMDVHPSPEHGARWDSEVGYKNYWKLRNQKKVGISYGIKEKKYFLDDDLFK